MRSTIIPLTLLLAGGIGVPVAAQPPARGAAAPPPLKGVFESVSYGEDLSLRTVFFVTADAGWVGGASGTILHTADGGRNWTAQLGGDPADKAAAITHLHFVDERHGWAKQDRKLLATRDGASWEEIGTLPYTVSDIAFLSPSVGLVAGGADIYTRGASTVYRTTDGGRSWKPAWTCDAKVQLGGLARTLACTVEQFSFVTPLVGFAVVRNRCTGAGCEPPPLLARTVDGGLTWEVLPGPGVPEEDAVTSVAFLDERTGFARLASEKLHMTTDGGVTWRGIVASPGIAMRFADPGVAWAMPLRRLDPTISFTTDGGARWSARGMRFPAQVNAFALPRRDRGYLVGEHGMIYRYRVVPASQALRANDLAAPAMPAMATPMDEQLQGLEKVVADLSQTVGGGATGTDTVPTVRAATDVAPGDALASMNAPLPPPSTFIAKCCARAGAQMEAILGALSQSLPEFIGRYRNLNLLLAAVRMSVDMPVQYRQVREQLGRFRAAQSKEDAAAALGELRTALGALRRSTAAAMQQPSSPASPGGPLP